MTPQQEVSTGLPVPVKAPMEPLRAAFLLAKKKYPQWDGRPYGAEKLGPDPILAAAALFLWLSCYRGCAKMIHSAEFRNRHLVQVRGSGGQLLLTLTPGDWHSNKQSLLAVGHILFNLAPGRFSSARHAVEFVKSHGWERWTVNTEETIQ